MGCSLACMLLMTVAGREATRELDVFQVMEMRSVIGLAMLYPLIRLAGGFRAMRTARLWPHVGRNIAHYAGQFAWLLALGMIPLAQLIAIEFTSPIWTALLAIGFLGERMNVWKTTAIAFGLVGVVIIVRPGVGAFDQGQLVVLGAAFAFAISFTMIKSLTRTESVVSIIFWMLAIQSVIGLIPAIMVWRQPSGEVWPWILAIAFAGSFAHYCMARAMVHADATVVMPMDFLRVPATAGVGWLLYAERIDLLTALGAALILTGNLLNLLGRHGRPPALPPAA